MSNSHVFCSAIWLQNSTVFQFSMFYAPHHITTVPATESQIEAEAAAVRTAVETFCPFKIVLDRVVLTSTGVLLGCWQVTAGADPATIRATLRSAFQRSPDKQLYDTAILHTSFARLPGNPTTPSLQPRTTRRFPMMQCSFSTS
ncbi:unnamed protein product [Linum trigynum]|uniref:Uncharacterized protein n=1 Tax=Linum trigynum TaxID=586398 RepID=A0AAV2D5X6_9ROSI